MLFPFSLPHFAAQTCTYNLMSLYLIVFIQHFGIFLEKAVRSSCGWEVKQGTSNPEKCYVRTCAPWKIIPSSFRLQAGERKTQRCIISLRRNSGTRLSMVWRVSNNNQLSPSSLPFWVCGLCLHVCHFMFQMCWPYPKPISQQNYEAPEQFLACLTPSPPSFTFCSSISLSPYSAHTRIIAKVRIMSTFL